MVVRGPGPGEAREDPDFNDEGQVACKDVGGGSRDLGRDRELSTTSTGSTPTSPRCKQGQPVVARELLGGPRDYYNGTADLGGGPL